MSKRTQTQTPAIDPTSEDLQWYATRISLAASWWTNDKFYSEYTSEQRQWAADFEQACEAAAISLGDIEDCLVDEIKAQR